jgi:hypothetical protein
MNVIVEKWEGHGFSRAEERRKRNRLQPLGWLVRAVQRTPSGLKPHDL